MSYFTKRSCADLLGATGRGPVAFPGLTFLPGYARPALAPLAGVSLAEDFQVLSLAALVRQNAELAAAKAAFLTAWLVFAHSGQGDFWLLHKYRNETGFYDHNAEDYALNTVDSLRLTLEGWVEVADLYHQFDLLNETTPSAFTPAYALKPEYKQDFTNQLDTISPGLFERLPFTSL